MGLFIIFFAGTGQHGNKTLGVNHSFLINVHVVKGIVYFLGCEFVAKGQQSFTHRSPLIFPLVSKVLKASIITESSSDPAVTSPTRHSEY
ncbi:GSCOCG00003923001-RA-CDS [Cotesia congregata]|nr:GSCOCG00003923001-RA-CDS [Cotesia congregata]